MRTWTGFGKANRRIAKVQPHSAFVYLWFLILVMALQLFGMASRGFAAEASYHVVAGPCHLTFPKDHGAHPGYRTEWWYYTGNLRGEDDREFGFQLTFFRRQMSPPGTERTWPEPRSAWRTQQLYLAHAALTDVKGKQFYHAEQMSREMPGLAGADQKDGATWVYLRNWSSRLKEHVQELEANGEGFGFKLQVRSLKDPVLHGEAGYSRKGTSPEDASCYYSLTRLAVDGVITLGGASVAVRGTAWMDHEFSSAPLEEDLAGWDWFSLQLSDHSELMVYLLRKKDGSISAASSGTYVDAFGRVVALKRDAVRVDTLDHWHSRHSGTGYPSRWRLQVAHMGLELTIVPKVLDQELETPGTTGITYWEGSVAAGGTMSGVEVTGEGYVELTGYAAAANARM